MEVIIKIYCIHQAATFCHFSCVHILYISGIKMKKASDDGRTVLTSASLHRRKKC